MSTKRDKRRQRRTRKEDQRRGAEARRQTRERARVSAEKAAAARRDLVAAAADPDRFVSRLLEILATEQERDPSDRPGEDWFRTRMLADEVGADQARVLADRLIAEPTDAAELGWSVVGLYQGAGDLVRAEEVASGLALTGDESGGIDEATAWIVAHLRMEAGMPARAADLAFKMCEADPDDPDGMEVLAAALEQLHQADQPESPESPESPDPAGEAALARFTDRSRLEHLRGALASFVERDRELAAWTRAAQDEWKAAFLDTAEIDDWDRLTGHHPFAAEDPDGHSAIAADTPLAQLAAESIWTRGPVPDEPQQEPDEYDASHSLLNRLAADPDTPPDLARLARDWQRMSRSGLWQVADPTPSPGVWVTDLVTRRSVYAAMAPGHLEHLPRWSVLAGCLFPDQGVWRAGGAFVVFDPTEGDRAAELAITTAAGVIGDLAHEHHLKGAANLRHIEPELSDVPPHGVAAGIAEAVDEPVASLQARVLGVAFPIVLGAVCESRRPPQLINTDRDPLEFLKLTAPVPDPDGLRAALVRRPEFQVDPADGSIVWRGREMTPLELETTRARVGDWATEEGLGPVEPPDGPQRYIRGVLTIEGGMLSIEVNSRHRLETISRLLAKLGLRDLVVEQRLDPALDMALPTGWRPLGSAGSAEAEDVWRRHWLDEKLPALGTSPRQARHDARGAIRLEGLLRQFEFDADRARFSGERPIDVGQIREQLADDDGRAFSL